MPPPSKADIAAAAAAPSPPPPPAAPAPPAASNSLSKEELEAAALKIQSLQRGRAARARVEDLKKAQARAAPAPLSHTACTHMLRVLQQQQCGMRRGRWGLRHSATKREDQNLISDLSRHLSRRRRARRPRGVWLRFRTSLRRSRTSRPRRLRPLRSASR